MTELIYLDCQATTRLEPCVREAMAPWWEQQFGNPGSPHRYGWEAHAAVERAREQVLRALQAPADGMLVFTSGATEANNLALKGVAEANHHRGRHLITVATEHSSVLAPCRYLERLGFELTVLPVNTDGRVSPSQLAAALRPDTILVSVMAANNEIGVLQPLAELGQICRERRVLLHCDAAQAVGKLPLNLQTLPVDLLSCSGHKLGGPQGIGALWMRAVVAIAPQQHGGGQQQGLRSGTLPVALIVGLGAAVERAVGAMAEEQAAIARLRDQLWEALKPLGGIHLNGHPQQRLAGNLNVSIDGVDGNRLLQAVRSRLAISSGSTCAAGAPSHVLQALGRSPAQIRASLRIGLDRHTTPEEVAIASRILRETIAALHRSA